ncbi:trimeric LpxA-like protein [Hyaloraphidium curvatum]|nr:trimeric LpxA-like protein [Hyaloraphidium curvatum]
MAAPLPPVKAAGSADSNAAGSPHSASRHDPGRLAILLRCGGAQAAVMWEVLRDKYAAETSAGRVASWDDGPRIHRTLGGVAHLRNAEEVRAWLASRAPDGVHAFVCHGEPKARKKLVPELEAALEGYRVEFPVVVSPWALVTRTSVIGRGTYVGSFANVGNACVVGEFARVAGSSVLGHDCVLAPYAQLNGKLAVGGGCELGEGCLIGMGCVVRDHVRVAPWTTLGMGAVLARSIEEPGQTWVGIPAKPLARKRAAGAVVGGEEKESRL